MNEIEKHVKKLFKSHKKNKQIQELKEEVYANLLARKEDLQLDGYNEEEAINQTIANIDSVDYLIENKKKIDLNQFYAHLFQSMTLYSVIIWISTFPFLLYREHFLLSYLFLLLSIILGTFYILYTRKVNNDSTNIKFMNVKSFKRLQSVTWKLWWLFIAFSMVSVTGIYFASDIWFSRPLTISGPYEFGEIISRYLVPLISIIVPLTIKRAASLVENSEVVMDEEY